MAKQEKTKKKSLKVGAVWASKDNPDNFYVALGAKSDNPKYDYHVEITVKNGDGEVVAKQTDGFLSLWDPRKSQYANQEALAKVPNLQFDLSINKED